jgi:hypothetical protein
VIYSSEKNEKLGESRETPKTLGRAIHRKGNKHARGFPLDIPNR